MIDRYQSAIKFLGAKAIVRQDDQLEFQRLQNKLAKLRYETNEYHAIEKLLKAQANFKELLEKQKAFITEADAVLQAAEERTSKLASFQNMLMVFNEHNEEFIKRADEQEAKADAKKNRDSSGCESGGAD